MRIVAAKRAGGGFRPEGMEGPKRSIFGVEILHTFNGNEDFESK